MRCLPATPLALIAAVAGGFAIACNAGQSAAPSPTELPPSPSPQPSAPPLDAYVASVLDVMSSLDSYTVLVEDEWGFGTRTIDWMAPDAYRHHYQDKLGAYEGAIETVYWGDSAYWKFCFGERGEAECNDWIEEARYANGGVIDEAGEHGHPWLLAALPLVGGLTLAEDGDGDTHDLLHIRGTVNPLEAQYRAEEAALGAWGTGENGLPCYPPVPETSGEPCHEFDIEALRSDRTYERYNVLPPRIDIWLSPDDYRVKIYSMRIDVPGYSYISRYEYLEYGGVTVSPPPPDEISARP